MQVWVPHSDIERSVGVLDWRRLGKQRLECQQILNTVRGVSFGWSHHPTVIMWMESPQWLTLYGLACCSEWIRRGYRDNMLNWFKGQYSPVELLTAIPPSWWGLEPIHSSHRARLKAKDPDYYGQFGWKEKPRQSVLYATVLPQEETLH